MRTQDPSVRAGEDISCLILRPHYDRQLINIIKLFYNPFSMYPLFCIGLLLLLHRLQLAIRILPLDWMEEQQSTSEHIVCYGILMNC
jgi:hypothetical protein